MRESSQGEPEAAGQRDKLAKGMTQEQIAEAQRLAAKWKKEIQADAKGS